VLLTLDYLVKKYNLKINGVSHFGAHLGEEVSSYKALNIKNIHLFEPQSKIFNSLKKDFLDDKDVFLYNFGLGEQNISMQMFIPENYEMSASLLEPKHHKTLYPDISFQGSEEVEIRIYDELKIEDVNFLNIDIQGYELLALKGSQEALRNKIDYIFIEVAMIDLYKNNALVGELDEFLEEFNFIRVETKWVNRFVLWGDALYIKKHNLNALRVYKGKTIKFLENFSMYFLFIDFLRLFKRIKNKTKQFIKTILGII